MKSDNKNINVQPSELYAHVSIRRIFREDETEEQARQRLHTVLTDSLSTLADHSIDFKIDPKEQNDSENDILFGIIENALENHQYRIMDGNADSVFVRTRSTERDFEIKISEISE